MSLRRNHVGSDARCGHCGRPGWAQWLCPTGVACAICPDCAGVLVYRRHDEKKADGSMPPPSGWPRLLRAVP